MGKGSEDAERYDGEAKGAGVGGEEEAGEREGLLERSEGEEG
jgi:hypothetical protein